MEFKLLFLLAFVALALGDETQEADEKIEIEILSPAPDDCEIKSKKYDHLAMHYTGTLTETGVKFDSSFDRDNSQPFSFQLGTGQVIKGWDEGLLDMCVGEKRKLIIPASKGYGSEGAGETIPPNAGLTFEVELMEITDGEMPPNVFKEIDVNQDNQLSTDEVSDYLKKQAGNYESEEGGKTTEEQHTELINQIFQHEDKDKDGFISHDEFSGPKHDEL